ncbi:MAG: ABC-type transport auxiliary lipoprotein family protein [Deltaproteobacteria bacterium]|nr:ABC-type transport auxiliary lipoprotein family protein [Deltaproteobacteria bacterium]
MTLILLLLLIPACTTGRSPGRAFENYTLEYAPPVFNNLTQLNELMRVDRFSAAQAFNSTDMLYRSGPSVLNAYAYHRWKATPPDIVTDLILRDLKRGGLFKAVFSEYDEADARFVLQGRIEEFLEIEEKGSRKACLALDITLLDRSQRNPSKGVLFQRGYRALEPLDATTPGAFARGMGRAMEQVSRQMTSDIYGAVKNIGKSEDSKPAP